MPCGRSLDVSRRRSTSNIVRSQIQVRAIHERKTPCRNGKKVFSRLFKTIADKERPENAAPMQRDLIETNATTEKSLLYKSLSADFEPADRAQKTD